MKKSILIFFSLAISTLSNAQTIAGQVLNEKNQPIDFANVILMTSSDSTFVAGAVCDDKGDFSLNTGNLRKAYFLRVSSIGYKSTDMSLDSCHANTLYTVVLQDDAKLLDEIVVKGSLPRTRLKNGAQVTSVAGTVLERVGTGIDVLNKLPGIDIANDKITVFGRGVPLIYINDRPIQDQDELSQLTSDDIQKIEIITNPGVQYDKSIKAVIKIQTKEKAKGLGFSERSFARYNRKWSTSHQVNSSYRYQKIDVSGMVAYSLNSFLQKTKGEQSTFLDYDWKQQMDVNQHRENQNLTANLTLNYTLNDKHSIGGNYRFNRRFRDLDHLSFATDFYRNVALFENSQTNTLYSGQTSTHEGNLYYVGKVDKLNIDFNGNLIRNINKLPSLTNEDIVNSEHENEKNTIHSNTKSKSSLYLAKLILSYPLWNGNLSFGGEYNYTHRTSNYVNEESILSNDDSKINEKLYAAFVEYGYSISILNLKGGLRYEKYKFDYFESDVYQPDKSRKNNHYYPHLSISAPIKDVNIELSYDADVSRPTYDMITNTTQYVNRYTYHKGNPFLKQNITNSLSCTVSYKWLLLYANYQHNQNEIQIMMDNYSAADPTIAIETYINAPSYNSTNVSLTAMPKIGIWTPQWNLSMYKQWYSIDAPAIYNEAKIKLNRPSFSFKWQNGIQLPLGIFANADISWNGKSDLGNTSFKNKWWVDISLQKYVGKDKLNFILRGNDIFDTYRNKFKQYYGSIRMSYFESKERRQSISIAIQYKINMQKSKYKGTDIGEEQRSRL